MGRKTSFYLSDEDDALLAAKREQGVGLAEIFHRGIHAEDPADRRARDVAAAAVDAAEDRLMGLARDMLQDAVREALRQGGGY
jgi:hypothetical protein